MKPEINFIKKLEAFFDDEFNDYTKKRIELYLKEYKDELPPVIVKKEVSVEEISKLFTSANNVKKHLVSKTYPTISDLNNDAKEICELYQINIDEFMNRKNLKARANVADARKRFCQIAFDRYFCSTNTLAKFFKVHHSTISFYIHGKKIRKSANSLTKKVEHA